MKNKTSTTWLAFLLGSVGAHWFYLGKKTLGVVYLVLFPLSFFAGCIDAIRLGLLPAEAFNQRFNPDAPIDTPQGSGLTVLGIGLSLAVGMAAFMSCLAMLFQWYFAGSIA